MEAESRSCLKAPPFLLLSEPRLEEELVWGVGGGVWGGEAGPQVRVWRSFGVFAASPRAPKLQSTAQRKPSYPHGTMNWRPRMSDLVLMGLPPQS